MLCSWEGAGLVKSNGSLPQVDYLSPAGWLPVHQDQFPAQHSAASMGKPFTFTVIISFAILFIQETIIYSHFTNRLMKSSLKQTYKLPIS